MRLKYSLFISVIFFSLPLCGQTMKEAVALFESGQLDSAIAISKQYTRTEPGAYQIIGQAFVRQGKFTEAIAYLEKGKNAENAEPSIRAWCMHDLGVAYFMRGDYAKTKENIYGCIEMNATANSVRSAKSAADLFGISELYGTWLKKETKHFIFHFQELPENVDRYVAAKEMAFDSINRFFRAALPKKIDYFVWRDTKQAEHIFNEPLAFTKPLFCVTHTSLQNSLGHEMTHSISSYATNIKTTNKLIFEGIASYFDLSGRDRMREIKSMALQTGGTISIKSTWMSNDHTPAPILYSLGAVLTGGLIQNFGRDKFIQLLADQSYDNARKIYGPALDELIAGLEKEINH